MQCHERWDGLLPWLSRKPLFPPPTPNQLALIAPEDRRLKARATRRRMAPSGARWHHARPASSTRAPARSWHSASRPGCGTSGALLFFLYPRTRGTLRTLAPELCWSEVLNFCLPEQRAKAAVPRRQVALGEAMPRYEALTKRIDMAEMPAICLPWPALTPKGSRPRAAGFAPCKLSLLCFLPSSSFFFLPSSSFFFLLPSFLLLLAQST